MTEPPPFPWHSEIIYSWLLTIQIGYALINLIPYEVPQ